MAVTLFGCSYEELELARLESPIVNGTVDPGHPAAGMATIQGQGSCSGTLIGTRTVLTAAHCVVEKDNKTLSPNQGYSPDGKMPSIPAVSVVYHPSYDGVMINNDVAVMRLSQDVPGITPAIVSKTPPNVGEQLIIVGFGYTSDQASHTFGTKRVAKNNIGKVTPTQYVFYGASGNVGSHCYGDSGGPSFVMRGGKEYLVGVHSWGESQCGVAEHDARADAYYNWIKQQAQGNLYEQGPTAPTDSDAPTVQITAPGPNAQVGPAFQVQVEAQDDVGVTKVELLVDGQVVGSQPNAPASFPVNGLPPGPHNLRAEVLDASGKRGSTMVAVHVQGQQGPDTSPPPFDPNNPGSPPNNNPTLPPNTPPPAVGGGTMLGSCALAPLDRAAGAPSLWPLLLPLALLVFRRRRR